MRVVLPAADGIRLPSSVNPNARVSATNRRTTLRSFLLARSSLWMRTLWMGME